MKVLVFGGRDFADRGLVRRTLTSLHIQSEAGISMVIEGGATGADRLAREWAVSSGIHVATVNALWDHFRRAAGPKRNAAMLLLKPDMAVGFPGGAGTASMTQMASDAGIPVLQIRGDDK